MEFNEQSEQLLKKSQELKSQAGQIISESKIAEIMAEYGEVKFSGSYPLDVMSRPDLDIYTISDKDDLAKFWEIYGKIGSQIYFPKIEMRDFVNFPPDGNSSGFYLQPKVSIGENNWKLDVYFMTADQYQPHTEKFLELLNNHPNPAEARLKILELKAHFKEGTKYKPGINGEKIYRAVLEHGVTTPEEFENYLTSQTNSKP